MGAPGTQTFEYDMSHRVASYAGMYGLSIGNFRKGSTTRRSFVSHRRQMDLVNGIPLPGSDPAYHISHEYLDLSQRLYTFRVTEDAKYGGAYIGASYNKEAGKGDGTTTTFTGTVYFNRCHPGTVTVWMDDVKIGYDNAEGKLFGTKLTADVCTIDYETGAFSVAFDIPPPAGSIIYVRWGFPSTGFTTGYSDPKTYAFDGIPLSQSIKDPTSGDLYEDLMVPYPLKEPESIVSAVGDATFVLSDGDVVIAYGDDFGDLVDEGTNLDADGDNYVDYTSGTLKFELAADYTGDKEFSVNFFSRSVYLMVIYGESEGDWLDPYSLVITKSDVVRNRFQIIVNELQHSGAYVPVGDHKVARSHKIDGHEKQMYVEDLLNNKNSYIKAHDNHYIEDATWLIATESIPHNNIQGKYNSIAMTGGDPGTLPGLEKYLQALELFSNKDDVKIDVVMDTVGHPTYHQAIIELCDRDFGGRADCFGCLNVPLDVEEQTDYVDATVAYRKYGLITSSSFVSLWFGHVKEYDVYNGMDIYVPLSGFRAGAFSYTADAHHAWMPAAGWKRGKINVGGLLTPLKKGERDVLYDNDINTLKMKPNKGVALYGNKTLNGEDSSRDSENVRWCLIVIENAIEDFLDNYNFDINDPYTRRRCRDQMNTYLANIRRNRGLYAFKVHVDDLNNPWVSIDNLEMYADYYIQPTKAIEHIKARAIITPSGAKFDDYMLHKTMMSTM
jgi:hypothetical protein